MGDHAAFQKRLDFYKMVLRKPYPDAPRFKGYVGSEYLTNALKVDPSWLEKSAQFFELDHTHPPDLFVLAHILAEEVFGTRVRGRKKGNKIWTDQRYLELAFKYYELKGQRPKLNDTKLAELISQEKAFREYRNNSELIRQRLYKARQEYKVWSEYQNEEAWIDSMIENRPDPDDYSDDGRDD
jgi:hypothetical protein